MLLCSAPPPLSFHKSRIPLDLVVKANYSFYLTPRDGRQHAFSIDISLGSMVELEEGQAFQLGLPSTLHKHMLSRPAPEALNFVALPETAPLNPGQGATCRPISTVLPGQSPGPFLTSQAQYLSSPTRTYSFTPPFPSTNSTQLTFDDRLTASLPPWPGMQSSEARTSFNYSNSVSDKQQSSFYHFKKRRQTKAACVRQPFNWSRAFVDIFS